MITLANETSKNQNGDNTSTYSAGNNLGFAHIIL